MSKNTALIIRIINMNVAAAEKAEKAAWLKVETERAAYYVRERAAWAADPAARAATEAHAHAVKAHRVVAEALSAAEAVHAAAVEEHRAAAAVQAPDEHSMLVRRLDADRTVREIQDTLWPLEVAMEAARFERNFARQAVSVKLDDTAFKTALAVHVATLEELAAARAASR